MLNITQYSRLRRHQASRPQTCSPASPTASQRRLRVPDFGPFGYYGMLNAPLHLPCVLRENSINKSNRELYPVARST